MTDIPDRLDIVVVSDRPMTKTPDVTIASDGRDICVMIGGVRIARRGHPDTPEAGTWISLVSGWTVEDHSGGPLSVY